MVALGTAVIGLPSLADSPAMYRPRVGWLQAFTVPRWCARRVANSVQSIISTPPGPTAVDAREIMRCHFLPGKPDRSVRALEPGVTRERRRDRHCDRVCPVLRALLWPAGPGHGRSGPDALGGRS